MGFLHHKTLSIPAQVSCLTFVEPRRLLVGSDDGSVRLYDLDTLKVLKAIRGLGSVSSVAFRPQSPIARPSLWAAAGRQALLFSLETDKLISTLSDALQTLDISADEDDAIGELSINAKGTEMAFCTDSGTVGVVDLQGNEITRMKQSHSNVCGSVRFIPDRPSELVSAGYDYALLHFDFARGRVISRDDLTAAPPSSGVSLSPPFVLSLSISPTGIIAAGAANGLLYIGTCGERSSETQGGQRKRHRKWQGLRMEGRILADVAEGPIVALAFTGPRELLVCTLLGKITQYQICGSAAGGTLTIEPTWKGEGEGIYKVNSMVCSEKCFVVGGFQKDGCGVIEVWSSG